MGEKTKNRALSEKRHLHEFIEKVKQYLLTFSFVIGLLRVRDEVKTIIPNPFADEPSDTGPTSSRSHGSKNKVHVFQNHFFEPTIVNLISTRRERSC